MSRFQSVSNMALCHFCLTTTETSYKLNVISAQVTDKSFFHHKLEICCINQRITGIL